MDILRVLIVGSPERLDRITSTLAQAGHAIVPVNGLDDALEMLLIQRFDAVLLGLSVTGAEIPTFTSKVRDLDRRSGAETRTALLSVVSETVESKPADTGIDEFVSETIDPDSLTLAIARLATAVGTEHSQAGSSGQPDLPILDVEQLREQVAFDDELLVELIDLFICERLRQSVEMQQASRAGDYERLSRVAHTIKGSLGSLHAMVAKEHAQSLELSAKNCEGVNSERFLAALERDLDILEEHLITVRKSVNPS